MMRSAFACSVSLVLRMITGRSEKQRRVYVWLAALSGQADERGDDYVAYFPMFLAI